MEDKSMKRFFVVLLIALFMSTNAFALGDVVSPVITTAPVIAPVNTVVVAPVIAPVTTAISGANADAAALAISKAVSVSGAKAKSESSADNSFVSSIVFERDYMQTLQIQPFDVGTYQGGKIDFDAIKNFGAISGIKRVAENEEIIDVIDVENGFSWNRVRLYEVLPLLVKTAKKFKDDTRQIRFVLYSQDASSNGGIGGGVGASITGNDAMTGSGSILPGVHINKFDPEYTLTIVEVQKKK
jgi:hypothetical protein